MPIDWTKGKDNDVVSELSAEQKEIWDEMFVCLSEIEAIIHKGPTLLKRNQMPVGYDSFVAAYLLTEISDCNNPQSIPFSALEELGIDTDILDFAKSHSISDNWQELLTLLQKHNKNIFALVSTLNFHSDRYTTPDSINTLSAILLDVRNGERFCDLCCGPGYTAHIIKESSPGAIVSGYDINKDAIAIAKAHSASINDSIVFQQSDMFELVLDDKRTTFNKIFANYPFGMKLKDLDAGKKYLDLLCKRIPSFSRSTSSDWLYNMLMVDLLEEGGKAIGIMTNGGTWNMIDAPIRQHFVENGLIECVIALPNKVFYGTSVQTSLIVLSHGNKAVRLVDATEWAQFGRRDATLSDEDIERIVSATIEDSEKSRLLSVEELRENNYVLNINRYVDGSAFIKNGVAFGELITKISRGLQLNAKDLDKLTSAAPTNLQYLSLSSIQNGIIEKNLPYLDNSNPKFERYLLKNHCLILSKSGFPYKIAVAEVEEGQNILASGNLYIIELDTDKVNPYYLAAYFSSEQGSAALKGISVGATLSTIGVDQLKKMRVPLLEIDNQNTIAEKYLAVRDEIELLHLKLEKAKDRLCDVFNEEGE